MAEAPNPLQMIEEVEHLVYARRTSEATRSLLRLSARLQSFNGPDGLLPTQFPSALRQSVYTRIAAACATLVTDPEFSPSAEQFQEFCLYKVAFHYVYAASGFNDATHLGILLGQRHASGSLQFSEESLTKLALFSALDDLPLPILELALRLPSAKLLPLLLSWLGQRVVLSVRGEQNRARLLESGSLVENEILTDITLALLLPAWMYCSYASHPQKHEIKRSLNRLVCNWMHAMGVHVTCAPRAIRDRPTLVVLGEHLRSDHAMFRSYAEKIRQLREHFRLVLVAPATQQDQVVRGCFDEWVEVSRQPEDLPDTVAKIEALTPDLIYYPSVGMTILSIALANLRLAPIQFMTVGHPATSMSEHMDYVILGENTRNSADSFNEIVVIRPGRGYHERHPSLPTNMPVRMSNKEGLLEVAVNGMVMKLSHRILDICDRLQRESPRSLRFHFFAGEKGVRQDGIRSLLDRRFPDAVVNPFLSYPDYLQALARCDLVLSPFPFGNTNCTVDAIVLGLPLVAYSGPEPHSQTDRGIMRKLDLPSWLVAENDEDYFRAALRLITGNKERERIMEHMRSIDVHKSLFSLPEGEEAGTFLHTVLWLYHNHEKIAASGIRKWARLDEMSASGVDGWWSFTGEMS